MVFAWLGFFGSSHSFWISSGFIKVIGRFYRTYRQPFAVLPRPVIANIIGLNYSGIVFSVILLPISFKCSYAYPIWKYL